MCSPIPIGLATKIRPTWLARCAAWLARPENQLLLLLSLAVFPLYYELGRNPIQLWDESRMAVNAAEMAHDGHWLVPHFGGQPDHWNTKPPLLIWLEALSFWAFGFSAWALRLPTLAATLATVVLLFRFAATVLQRPLAGFLGAVVLVTCEGYLRVHVARTGDYDALLTCWQVLLWTQFFQYLENGRRRHLLWAAGALLAATLTKGPAGLLGLPGLVAYAAACGRLRFLLRQPSLYLATAGYLLVLGSYFLVREAIDPGYWQAVQRNDVGGRFFTAVSGHGSTWPYYLEYIKNHYFDRWLWALAPAVLLAWLEPASPARRAAGLLLAFVSGWLVVITLAKTKLVWYDAPIYPALALLVGLGLNRFWQDVRGHYLSRLSRAAGWALRLGLFLTLFYGSYHDVVRRLIAERTSDYGMGTDGYASRYLSTLAQAQPQLSALTLLAQDARSPVLRYYQLQVAHTPGHHLAVVPGQAARQLPTGRVVVVCDPGYRAALDSVFRVVLLHEEAPCQTLQLLPRQ
jgi:4-amino-4-deoxy-L-arabinose transferase-like glycosyltransferase